MVWVKLGYVKLCWVELGCDNLGLGVVDRVGLGRTNGIVCSPGTIHYMAV